MKERLRGNMWIKRSEFQRLKNYEKDYQQMRSSRDLHMEKNKELSAEVETLRSKTNQQSIMIEMIQLSEADLNARHTAICKNLASVKIENATLRQILRDLTNKPVNELIEAHRKAVRILQYDEVKEEQSE
jgi:hypothetical protein